MSEKSSFSDFPFIKDIAKKVVDRKKDKKRKEKLAKGRKKYKGVEYKGELSERQKRMIDISNKINK